VTRPNSGDNDTADEAEGGLPDEIGLDRTRLMAKPAGGGVGGTVAP
jgi:hypothetical protein